MVNFLKPDVLDCSCPLREVSYTGVEGKSHVEVKSTLTTQDLRSPDNQHALAMRFSCKFEPLANPLNLVQI